jgi:plasmid stabilization system protein ParE
MDRHVRWASSASQDLIDLLEYIAEDRADAATRLGKRILDAADTLSRHPLKGRVVRELSVGLRSRLQQPI